jgi:hypothetical protein
MKEQMAKLAKKAVKSHEDRMHKGKQKMAMGGMVKKHGRAMAKAMNQRGK